MARSQAGKQRVSYESEFQGQETPPSGGEAAFGTFVRASRQRSGIGLRSLGERSGIDAANLSRIERGCRKPPTGQALKRLMSALQIPAGSRDAEFFYGAAAQSRLELPCPTAQPGTSPAPDGQDRQCEEAELLPTVDTPGGPPKPSRCIFGKLLRTIRQSRKITLADLARQSGIDEANLSRIECRKRKPPLGPKLLRLLEALRVSRDSREWGELVSAAAADHLKSRLVKGYLRALAKTVGAPGVYVDGYMGPSSDRTPTQICFEPSDADSRTALAEEIHRIALKYPIRTVSVETENGERFEISGRKGKRKGV
jgi:transcriptional regulator with XRE-family HTH domain